MAHGISESQLILGGKDTISPFALPHYIRKWSGVGERVWEEEAHHTQVEGKEQRDLDAPFPHAYFPVFSLVKWGSWLCWSLGCLEALRILQPPAGHWLVQWFLPIWILTLFGQKKVSLKRRRLPGKQTVQRIMYLVAVGQTSCVLVMLRGLLPFPVLITFWCVNEQASGKKPFSTHSSMAIPFPRPKPLAHTWQTTLTHAGEDTWSYKMQS